MKNYLMTGIWLMELELMLDALYNEEDKLQKNTRLLRTQKYEGNRRILGEQFCK